MQISKIGQNENFGKLCVVNSSKYAKILKPYIGDIDKITKGYYVYIDDVSRNSSGALRVGANSHNLVYPRVTIGQNNEQGFVSEMSFDFNPKKDKTALGDSFLAGAIIGSIKRAIDFLG